MAVLNITKDNFQKEVMESDKVVLLDFWADWCGPCKMMAPQIDAIAEERPDLKVGKVNVDQQQELAVEFQVMSIPTLVVIKNGEVVKKSIGMVPKEQVLSLIP
jgi:thioredoxin 1